MPLIYSPSVKHTTAAMRETRIVIWLTGLYLAVPRPVNHKIKAISAVGKLNDNFAGLSIDSISRNRQQVRGRGVNRVSASQEPRVQILFESLHMRSLLATGFRLQGCHFHHRPPHQSNAVIVCRPKQEKFAQEAQKT